MNHQTAAVAILCCANRTRRKTAEWAGGKCTIILSEDELLNAVTAIRSS